MSIAKKVEDLKCPKCGFLGIDTSGSLWAGPDEYDCEQTRVACGSCGADLEILRKVSTVFSARLHCSSDPDKGGQ